MARSRWQFSLASLLLFTTIVCLSLALCMTVVKLQMVQSELQEYRNELGHLTISDPNKVHAIGLEKSEPFKWYWHVHIPEKRKCYLRYMVGSIQKWDLPITEDDWELPAGEYTIIARMVHDLKGKKELSIELGFRGRAPAGSYVRSRWMGLEGENFEWLRGTVAHSSGPYKYTISADPGEPLLLLSQFWYEWDNAKGKQKATASTASKGIRIWIDEPQGG